MLVDAVDKYLLSYSLQLQKQESEIVVSNDEGVTWSICHLE